MFITTCTIHTSSEFITRWTKSVFVSQTKWVKQNTKHKASCIIVFSFCNIRLQSTFKVPNKFFMKYYAKKNLLTPCKMLYLKTIKSIVTVCKLIFIHKQKKFQLFLQYKLINMKNKSNLNKLPYLKNIGSPLNVGIVSKLRENYFVLKCGI